MGRADDRRGKAAGSRPKTSRQRRGTRIGLTLAAVLTLAPALHAQPLVQPLPQASAGQALNAALARLARDPRDLDALIDAGKAALGMGDVDAAVGFFARADQLSPNNMRVKAGLAGALVRSENPFDAIPLFAEAEKAGALDPALIADRGLAYDLVGDNATAQRHYRDSLALAPSDETTRRLAISQAIAGDRAGMELTLAPLLQRQDKAAWRTRTFALAILRKPEEAIAIADQTMPDDMAQSIAPYLRYMEKLTPAQQAAAANLGRFPRAADIGRDDPRVAAYAGPRRAGGVDGALVPAGKPLGRGRPARLASDERASTLAPDRTPPPAFGADRTAPSVPAPTRQTTPAPALAVAAPPEPRAAPARPVPATLPAAASPAPVALVPGGGFDLARVEGARQPASGSTATATATATAAAPTELPAVPPASAAPGPGAVPAPAVATPVVQPVPRAPEPAPVVQPAQRAPEPAPPEPKPVVATVTPTPQPAAVQPAAPKPAPKPAALAPAPRRGLSEAFADLAVASGPVTPAPGAVDVRKLAAAKAKAAKPVEPPKPVYPSRVWVQVGTGRNLAALGFTWKQLVKDNPALFKGKSPSTADWGRTNRLLAGPFPSQDAAEAWLAKLKKAGLDAFLWLSEKGEKVDDL